MEFRKGFIFIILIIFYSLSAFGKEYNCSYIFDEENFSLNLKKKTDYSYAFNMNYETEEYILAETDKLLIIGAPQYVEDSKSVFRVIFLDKLNKTISITSVIEPSFSQDYLRGIWGDVQGTCD